MAEAFLTSESEISQEQMEILFARMDKFIDLYIPKEIQKNNLSPSLFDNGIARSRMERYIDSQFQSLKEKLEKRRIDRLNKSVERQIEKDLPRDHKEYIRSAFSEDDAVSIGDIPTKFEPTKRSFEYIVEKVSQIYPKFKELNLLAKREILVKLTSLNKTTKLHSFNLDTLNHDIKEEVERLVTTYTDPVTNGLNRTFGEESIRTEFEKIARKVKSILEADESDEEKYQLIMEVLDVWFMMADVAGLHGFNVIGTGGQADGDKYVRDVLSGHGVLGLIRLGGDEMGIIYKRSELVEKIFSMAGEFCKQLTQDDIKTMTWREYLSAITSSFDSRKIIVPSKSPKLIKLIYQNTGKVKGDPYKEIRDMMDIKTIEYIQIAIKELREHTTKHQRNQEIEIKAEDVRLNRKSDIGDIIDRAEAMLYKDKDVVNYVKENFDKVKINGLLSYADRCLAHDIASGIFNTEEASNNLVSTISKIPAIAEGMKKDGTEMKKNLYEDNRQIKSHSLLSAIALNNRSFDETTQNARAELEKYVKEAIIESNNSLGGWGEQLNLLDLLDPL